MSKYLLILLCLCLVFSCNHKAGPATPAVENISTTDAPPLFIRYLGLFHDYNLDSISTYDMTVLSFMPEKDTLKRYLNELNDTLITAFICDAQNFDCLYRDLGNDSSKSKKYYETFCKQRLEQYYKVIYRVLYQDDMHDCEIYLTTYDLSGHKLSKLYIGNDVANCYRDSMNTQLRGDTIYIRHRTTYTDIKPNFNLDKYATEVFMFEKNGVIKFVNRKEDYVNRRKQRDHKQS